MINTKTPPAYRITVFNQSATAGRPLGPYIKARFGWFWQAAGTGTIQVKIDHPLAWRLMQCKRDVVPIRAVYNGKKWSGRVMHCEVSGVPGNEVVTATCIGDLFWLSTFLGWVNPILPVGFQVALTGKQDVVAGSADYVMKNLLAKQAARMGKPVHCALPLRNHTVLPNLKDVDSLDDLLDLINDAAASLQVVCSRFTPLDELFTQVLADTGVGVTMDLWVPEDGPSPEVFNGGSLMRLQNILKLSKLDNFLWFTNPNNVLGLADPSQWNRLQKPGYVFDTRGKRDRRRLTWRTDNGSIAKYTRKVSHPTAHSVIVGGKAPEFMNQIVEWAANAAIKALLNWLIPGAGLGDILIGDLLDDILFAYQKFDDYALATDLGPLSFGEAFGDNTSAWSLDAIAVGRTKLKAVGPKETLTLEVQSGGPGGMSFGVDDGSGKRFDVGDIMTFWDRGTTLEDYVSAVEVEDSPGERCTEYVTIGDQDAAEDALSKLIGHIKNLGAFSRAIANGTK